MKIINNITEKLVDDLRCHIRPNSKIAIAAACFSAYAYEGLKKELAQVEGFRFLFSSPTFLQSKTENRSKNFTFHGSVGKRPFTEANLRSNFAARPSAVSFS